MALIIFSTKKIAEFDRVGWMLNHTLVAPSRETSAQPFNYP